MRGQPVAGGSARRDEGEPVSGVTVLAQQLGIRASLVAGQSEHEPHPLAWVAVTEDTTVPARRSSSQPPSRLRSLGLVVTLRIRGAGVAAAIRIPPWWPG